MSYRFHPEALEEYQEATLYYAERDPSLALRFVEAVEDAIRRILEAPQRWRVLDEDVRRCLTAWQEQIYPPKFDEGRERPETQFPSLQPCHEHG